MRQMLSHLQLPSRYAIALKESNKFKHVMIASDAGADELPDSSDIKSTMVLKLPLLSKNRSPSDAKNTESASGCDVTK